MKRRMTPDILVNEIMAALGPKGELVWSTRIDKYCDDHGIEREDGRRHNNLFERAEVGEAGDHHRLLKFKLEPKSKANNLFALRLDAPRAPAPVGGHLGRHEARREGYVECAWDGNRWDWENAKVPHEDVRRESGVRPPVAGAGVVAAACDRRPVSDEFREQLLATYPDVRPAMVAQNVLETGGIPCRIYDLAGLPQQVFGFMGAHARPVGLWVLEVNSERAAALLAAAGADGSVVDEEALAAEALAAAPEATGSPTSDEGPAPRVPAPPSAVPSRSGRAAVALAIVAIAGAIIAYAFG